MGWPGARLTSVGYAPISRIASAPSPALSGDELTVTNETGAIFPAIPFLALAWPDGELPVVGDNAEYVQVTGRVGDVMTLVRSNSPVAILAGWLFAAVIRIPNYERGTEVTLRGHFAANVPPYRVYVQDPQGGTAVYDSATDDSAGNVSYSLTPPKSGLWAFRWEGADGMLEDQQFFVNHSVAL